MSKSTLAGAIRQRVVLDHGERRAQTGAPVFSKDGGYALGVRLPWPFGVAIASHVPFGTSFQALPS